MADQDQSQAATEGQPQDAGEDGFGSAFAERSQDPAAHKGTEAGAEAPAEQGKPADEAGRAEAPANAAVEQASGTEAPAFDPFADLKPEQKAYFERLQASERSNRGRVGALTKKLHKVAEGTPKPPEQAAEQDGTKKEGEAEAPTLEQKLDAVAEEYGDVNGPVVEALKEIRKEIDGLKASPNREQVTDDDAEEIAKAYDQLGGKHPDYAAVAQSPEFQTWAGQQPEKVKGLINSYDPQEVSLALTLYKAESKAPGQAPAERKGEGSAATDERRQRQLEGSRQAPTGGQPVAAGVPNEFGSAFKSRAASPPA